MTMSDQRQSKPGTPDRTVGQEAIDRLILVGNPNVGKSVIFGVLTGTYVIVSNYPGTTVEVSKGYLSRDGRKISVIDTPGTNSLIPNSEDERVTRDILLDSIGRCVVLQVGDAKNLGRTLSLTAQLSEMGLPVFLCLNMNDEAQTRGIEIDVKSLSQKLGIPVVKTIAHRRKGTDVLLKTPELAGFVSFRSSYSIALEKPAMEIAEVLDTRSSLSRSLSLMLLAGDTSLVSWLHERFSEDTIGKIDTIRRRVETELNDPVSYILSMERMKKAEDLASSVMIRGPQKSSPFSERLGWVTTRPLEGTIILLAVLCIMYMFVGKFGAEILVGLLEERLFGQFLSPKLIALMDYLAPFPHAHQLDEQGLILPVYTLVPATDPTFGAQIGKFIHDLLVGEFGILTMALPYAFAIVLPIVTTFFLAFGFLEDSGYMPRLAVVVNRVFRRFGMNGKAILPMVLGLGCDTMATLTTRLLETRKERLIAILLLTLGIPCSAQLGVILGMLSTLPVIYLFVWLAVVLGSLALTGYGASRILPGEQADFLMELPPLRMPRFKNIVIKTLARIEWYLKEAVPLFVLGTLVLFTLDKLNLLATLRSLAAPVVVNLLDLPGEAADAFVIGFLRRDFGAAGLYDLARKGGMDHIQIVTGLVTITLFVPCIAQFFITIKERGLKTAIAIAAFVFPFAILVGAVVNFTLRLLGGAS
ncbi:ferrous iron transport protein B [Acidobacteriota bacterium]